MSVFKVTLNNPCQGYMDIDPRTQAINPSAVDSTGVQMNPSIQRTIYVTGPNRTWRKLFDGQTFTDCNYWKRFAYPQVPLDQAFIKVVTDDGSVYSDFAAENNFPVINNVSVVGGTSYSTPANVIDYVGTYGNPASFVQLTNNSTGTVKVRLNGNTSAVFALTGGITQVFNAGDLSVSKLEFDNSASGSTTVSVSVLASVTSVCSS